MNSSGDLFFAHRYDGDSHQQLRPFSRLDDVVKVSILNDAVIPAATAMVSALTSSTFSPSNLLSSDRFMLSRNEHTDMSNATTATVIHSVMANATATPSSIGNAFIDEAGREFSSVLVHAIICNRLIDLDGYNSTTAAICGMMLFIGIIYISVGYRCFKLTMFLTGFLLGTTLVYLICSEENALGIWGNVGVALGSGLLLGLITMLVDYVGLFTLGLILGALMAVVTLVGMYMGSVIPSSMWTAIGLIFSEALFFALLTLWQSKFFTIFASSAFGAALLAAVIDYFIEKWRLTLWVADRIRLVRPSPNATLVMTSLFNGVDNPHSSLSLHSTGRSRSATVDDDLWLPAAGDQPHSSSGGQRAGELFGIGDGGEAFVHPSLCWYSWLILLSWPTFLLIGILAQWLLTAKDYYYYTDHSRHQKLDLQRRQQARASEVRRRRNSAATTGEADTSRGSRRARRASTSSVCYVSVEEDNGWHYRHATVPTTGVTAVGTVSSSSNAAANCDIESAQSTPFGSPCKTTSNATNTSTNTTTITTALTTARLLALGAEHALRKAGGGGGGQNHSSLFAAVTSGGGSISRGEPLRDSVKYKQMYRARRANGDVILQDRHDFSPTSAPPLHNLHHHNGTNNNNFSSSTPPSSSSVNSTWSASSQDQLMPHLQTQPTPQQSSSFRQQPTIKSSTSNHSEITGLSTVQSLPLPPIPTAAQSNNFVSSPPPNSSGGISLYANSSAAAAASVAAASFSSASRPDNPLHTPTLVQQIAPTKQKKSGRNSSSKQLRNGQPSSPAVNATDDRAFQRLTNSSATAFNSHNVNETAAPGGKNNRRKKKSSSSKRSSVNRNAQGATSAAQDQRRRSSLESSGDSQDASATSGAVIEMREPFGRSSVNSTKMM